MDSRLICLRLRLQAAEFWFSGKRRITAVTASVRAAPDFLKNKDTWCKILGYKIDTELYTAQRVFNGQWYRRYSVHLCLAESEWQPQRSVFVQQC